MTASSEHSGYDKRFPGAPSALEVAADINAAVLAERWWSIALRGVAALIFSAIALFWPGMTLIALVMVFGGFAIVEGVANLVMAGRGAKRGRPWGSLLFSGVAGVVLGVLSFVWPGITALALVMLVAVWALVTGIAEIAAAIRLRKQIRGEWLLGLSGLLSVAFGVLLLVFPKAGALTLVIWMGAYSLVFGVVLLALAFKLRRWQRGPERHLPTGGMPSPAS